MKQEAFELADELENKPNAYGDCAQDWLLAAAAMIRSLAVALDSTGQPVAWMQTHHKTGKPTRFSKFKTWEDDIPLYTAPQRKPLSDEMIQQLTESSIASLPTIQGWFSNTHSLDIPKFARAIEKAHGIE
jgi:hypothetical protein